MTKLKHYKKEILSFLIPAIVVCAVLLLVIPKAQPLLGKVSKEKQPDTKVEFVAIGDSLTEGVGDTTEEGGYVPLLKKALIEETVLKSVGTENFGKKGDTTKQIIDRIGSDLGIQKAIKSADFITLTVGGNDLMAVITKELTNHLDKETFVEPGKKYIADLTELYEMIRQFNPNAPIYQLGIYNPFNLSFSDISEFKDIVTNWDKQAQAAMEKQKNIHFVEINEELSNGRNDLKEDTKKEGNSQEFSIDTLKEEETKNNLISTEDNFHPNNLGYQLIANRFKEVIVKNTPEWDVK
ncbi:lipase [Vagococcus coleopterorum]|uniref:Lipase n=1 Tax=Vagococcus coleopterorum TaxID=2714946 RepID=A0A6G8ANS3_9ENTE|nr:GDSL-type esterase/lipase family protein [Vagococcus coleopterorum]QIL46620.1 lipase [Vagococcus coleopterorum]